MKTKLTLFVAVFAAALLGVGCASTEPAFVRNGLVAYYPFNGNAKDESGNGNDGEVKGPKLTKDRYLDNDRAYAFDGVDDIISRTGALSGRFDTFENLTYSVWVRVSQSMSKRRWASILENGPEAPNQRAALMLYYGEISFVGHHNDLFHERHIANVNWTHVVVSKSGKSVSVFVDGIHLNTKILVRDVGFASDLMSIGSNGSAFQEGEYFKGSIDDVRIYNRALAAKEVKALYDLEKPKTK